MNINFSIKINLFKLRKEKIKKYEPSAPPEYTIFSNKMTKTWCVGGRHKSKTKNNIQYEKVNPKTKILLKIIKGTCGIFGRNKTQFFTE